MNTHAAQVIETLGGTAEVSRLFGLSMPSVSDWKNDGIPPARMMYLRLAKKRDLKGIDLDAATAKGRKSQPAPAQA